MISNSYSETPSELRSENSSENHNECSECSELYSETPLEHYIVSSESSIYSEVSSLYSEACEAPQGQDELHRVSHCFYCENHACRGILGPCMGPTMVVNCYIITLLATIPTVYSV